jgi:hypothetical protein
VAIQFRAFDTTTSARSSTSWHNYQAAPKPSRELSSESDKPGAMNSGELRIHTTQPSRFESLFGFHRKVEQCSHFSLSTKQSWATFGTTALHARAKQVLISGVEKTQSEGGKVNE